MELFYSGVSDKNDPRQYLPNARVMRAFGRSLLKRDQFDSDCFLDSGAFTLRKFATGSDPWAYYRQSDFRLYLDQYAGFVKRWGVKLYANVDVIGNPELTYRDQKYLENEHGLKPVPVVHFGESLSWLEKYLSEGYDFVGIGGLVRGGRGTLGSNTADRRAVKIGWLDNAFEIICGGQVPRIRTHGFGVGDARVAVRYPWWSIDSTTWVMMAAMGSVLLTRRRRGQNVYDRPPHSIMVTLKSRKTRKPLFKAIHYFSLSDVARKRLLAWLEEIGVPFGSETEPGVSTDIICRCRVNACYLSKLAESVPEWPWPFGKVKGFFELSNSRC